MAGQLVALKAFLPNGSAAPGAKFRTFVAGTTTPLPAYADEAGTVPLANPVAANAYGIAAFYFKTGVGNYKFEVVSNDESQILLPTIDNYVPDVTDIYYIIGTNIGTALAAAIDAQEAAELAQALAETAATNAASSAATATTQATNASTSATAAATSATNAGNSAAAAAASATTASTGATTATTQAGIATTQATNAANSAAAADADRIVTEAFADADVDEPVEGQGIITFNPATAVNTTTNVITINAHGIENDDPLTYRHGGGTVIGGLTHDAQVWAVSVTTNTFAVSATRGGAPIDLTSVGSGTAHQFLPVRSAKHHAFYAESDANDASASAADAIAVEAVVRQYALGDYANAAAAVAANPDATAFRSRYFNTSDQLEHLLTSISPPVSQATTTVAATQAEAEAGTNSTKGMTPERTAQAIRAQATLLRADRTALKAITASQRALNTTVNVAGGAAFMDGWQGTFIFRTGDRSADVTADVEEALVVAPADGSTGSSGAWYRVFNGNKYFAEWWGVPMDGTTVGSAKLARCMELVAARGGGDIYLSDGTLLVEDVSAVPVGTGGKFGVRAGVWFKADGIRLHGAGVDRTTIKAANGSNCNVVQMGNSQNSGALENVAPVSVKNCFTYDMTLDGNAANQTAADATNHHYATHVQPAANNVSCGAVRCKSINSNYYGFASERSGSVAEHEGHLYDDCVVINSAADAFDTKGDDEDAHNNRIVNFRAYGFGANSGLSNQAGVDLRPGWYGENIYIEMGGNNSASESIGLRFQDGTAGGETSYAEQRSWVDGFTIKCSSASGRTGVRALAAHIGVYNGQISGCSIGMNLGGRDVLVDGCILFNNDENIRHQDASGTYVVNGHRVSNSVLRDPTNYNVRVTSTARDVSYSNCTLAKEAASATPALYIEAGARDVSISGGEVDHAPINLTLNPAADVTLATDTITKTAHGLLSGQRVLYLVGSSSTAMGGLATGRVYWTRDVTANTFKLAATNGGAAIDITSNGTGTNHFIQSMTIDDERGVLSVANVKGLEDTPRPEMLGLSFANLRERFDGDAPTTIWNSAGGQRGSGASAQSAVGGTDGGLWGLNLGSTVAFTFDPTTAVNTTTNVITIAGNTLANNDQVWYRAGTGGTVLGGLTEGRRYWVINKSGNNFELAATRGGTAVDITSLGAGTAHELYTMAVNCSQIASKNQVYGCAVKPLVMEVALRVQATDFSCPVFIGLVTTPGLFFPCGVESGPAIQVNDSNFVGFMFDPNAGNNWMLVAAKALTGQVLDSGVATDFFPTDLDRFRILVNPAGDAFFWIDDNFVGTLTNATTPGIWRANIIGMNPATTASRSVQVGQINLYNRVN